MKTPQAEIKRFFRQTSKGSASGTFWRLWGGWVSAHHVHTAQFREKPPFINAAPTTAGNLIDALAYGCRFPIERPRDPVDGEKITVFGYPAGCDKLMHRIGSVYFKRKESGSPGYNTPTWIVKIDEQPMFSPVPGYFDPGAMYEPVVVGMSGGLIQAANGDPLGILVTRGGVMDSDRDGQLEQTCDFVALSDFWDVFSGADQSGALIA